MGVFHVIERNMWRRGIMIMGLLGMAAVFYVMTTQSEHESRFFRTGIVSVEDLKTESSAEGNEVRVNTQDIEHNEATAVVASITTEPDFGHVWNDYLFERDRQRAARIEHLQTLVQNGVLQYGDAQPAEQLLRLLEYAEKEEQAERILRARGIKDVFVVMSDSKVHVVAAQVMTKDEVSTVGAIVSQVTGHPLSRITISDGATSL